MSRFIFPLLASILLSASGAHSRPSAVSYDKVVVFGDSISDNGNGSYILTNRTWPADPAYFDGRFSNGPTWAEHLADLASGGKILDLAYGGATLNNSRVQGYTGPNSTIPVPSVIGNVRSFIKRSNSPHHLGRHLFALSGGANDAFFASLEPGFEPRSFAKLSARTLMTAVHELTRAGAKHFLVLSTPALASTPYGINFVNQTERRTLETFTSSFADALRDEFKPHKDVHVTFFDQEHLLADIVKHARRHSYTNTEDACLQGAYGESPRKLCKHPNSYLFWDLYHPTARTHRYIGEAAYNALNGKPEFSSQYRRLPAMQK